MTRSAMARVWRGYVGGSVMAVALATAVWTTPPAVLAQQAAVAPAAASTLPAKLSDADFWKLASDISEPGGYFQITDNYTSNENEVGRMFTMLRERKVTGGVYVGVGPEQNFSYIAATQPDMAFIIDIRRMAVMQHLMFKAAFELSKDRADFISILFSKPRPAGIDSAVPIQALWNAFFASPVDPALVTKNHDRILAHLTKTRKFELTPDEVAQLETVLTAFVQFGPGITTRGAGGGGGNAVTFADLTGWSVDANSQVQSFLSTEENFRIVKALHDKNLIVPVSGDFGGTKALRAIGAYLTERNTSVNAFYVSNVEQYLFRDSKAPAFYANVATMPLKDSSVFIRPYALRRYAGPAALCGISAYLKAAAEGRITDNNRSLECIN
ncbi:MAG TPA: hypothetical protein VMS54_14010 [Vicinamibacterales bacterium]|nr:hypothetical protein [Vicinamibacterales bacterium]